MSYGDSQGEFMPKDCRLDIQSDQPDLLLHSEPGWRVCDPSDPLSVEVVQLNRSQLRIARACTPEGSDVVDGFTSRLAVRLGISQYRALSLCEVGMMLRDFPLVAEYLDQGHMSIVHVLRLSDGLAAVPPEHRREVDTAVVKRLSPHRPMQMTPTPGRVATVVREVVARVHPPARPREDNAPADDTQEQPGQSQDQRPQLDIDQRSQECTEFFLRLNKADAQEVTQMLDHVAKRQRCSRGEALMSLLRGQATTDVVLNLYVPLGDQTNAPSKQLHMGGHWLSRQVSQEWLDRVTHVQAPGYAQTTGYVPTPLIRASVEGRDGHCRFPGCGVPAHRCDLDHVQRWDPSRGQRETSTANLHCLCRKHHRLKTAGQWDVELHPDGSEVWTSHGDGHVVTTQPGGVLHRGTFTQRAMRRTVALARHNEQRMRPLAGSVEPALVLQNYGQHVPAANLG